MIVQTVFVLFFANHTTLCRCCVLAVKGAKCFEQHFALMLTVFSGASFPYLTCLE